MTTVSTDNIVMRFHPPWTPSKKQKVLHFWTSRLSPDAPDADGRLTLLALASPSKSTTDSTITSSNTNGPELAGMVELLTPQNALDTGPFRAELEVLMVSPQYRRFGLARRLVQELERQALLRRRTQVTLSTTRGSVAETKFYPRLGYTVFGVLPGYAFSPEGAEEGKEGGGRVRVDGVYFYKNLEPIEDGEGRRS